jgi:hypothetical protein
MQERSITNALLALRKQIIRGNLDGLDHVNALLVLRGVDLAALEPKRASSECRLPRRGMSALALDALREGPKRGRDVAAYVAEHSDMTHRQAIKRVYQPLTRLAELGVVRRDGRLWGLAQ